MSTVPVVLALTQNCQKKGEGECVCAYVACVGVCVRKREGETMCGNFARDCSVYCVDI